MSAALRCLCVLGWLGLIATAAGQTVGWRGDGTGQFPGQTPPIRWHGPDGKGIAWRTELPAIGSNSPIVCDGKLVVTGDPDWVFCLDASTGVELWKRQIDVFPKQSVQRQQLDAYIKAVRADWSKNKKLGQAKSLAAGIARMGLPTYGWPESNWSLATPSADAQAIYVSFSHGAVAALAWDGTLVWQHTLNAAQRPKHGAVSPLVVDDLVCFTEVVNERRQPVRHRLVAFDKRSGSKRWTSKTFTPGGNHCPTPVMLLVGQDRLVVTAGGAVIDARSGAIVKDRIGICGDGCSPVVADGSVWFLEGPGGGPKGPWTNRPQMWIYGMRLGGGAGQLEIERLHEFQVFPDRRRAYASPLVIDGLFYGYYRNRLWVVDLAAKKMVAEVSKGLFQLPRHAVAGKVNSNCYPSPVYAGGHLYLFRADTTCTVLTPGRQPKIVAVNQLTNNAEIMCSSPFCAEDKIFVRTMRAVYGLAKP